MSQELHIEGLDEFQDHDLTSEDDTPPDAIICKFEVVSEYMPALSAAAGKRVYKNFIHFNILKELGRYQNSFRLKDHVEFDETQKRWKIVKLAPKGESWIKQFPKEWNNFYNGVNSSTDGTPVEFLFPNDPTRAEMYKRSYVETIERLAALSETDCQLGGMGWIDDKKRAQGYLRKIEEGASGVQVNAQLTKMESENKSLRSEVAELTNQLTRLLQTQIDEANKAHEAPKKKLGRPAKVKEVIEPTQAEI